MARLVPKIIALDIPWHILITMRKAKDLEKTIMIVDSVNNNNPALNTLFLPTMSASLPNGIREIADDRIKLLITHPISIALAPRSFPIDGNARFTDDPRNGVRNAAKAATIRTAFLGSVQELHPILPEGIWDRPLSSLSEVVSWLLCIELLVRHAIHSARGRAPVRSRTAGCD